MMSVLLLLLLAPLLQRAPKKQRKNKSFMDGLLVVPASGPCRLLDDQGSVIARKSNWNAAARCLEPGSEAEVPPHRQERPFFLSSLS